MAKFKILDAASLEVALVGLPDWRVDEGELTTEYLFTNFAEAFAFITQVAMLAEKMNHHPTWSNTYNRVSISLSTHDAENKITDLDTKMADKISTAVSLYRYTLSL